MTISRFRGAHAALAALFLVSCGGGPPAKSEGGIIHSTHTAEIARIVLDSGPAEIERELAALLRRIAAAGGSPGTELVDAGFVPAPVHHQIYAWEGTGRAGRIGIRVTIDRQDIRVTVREGGWA